MTPFRFEEGERALRDLSEFCESDRVKLMKDQLWWYLNMIFDTVTEPDQHTEEGEPYDPQTDGVDLEIGYDVWVGACMLDAVLNGTGYGADCMAFSEMYGQVCAEMKLRLHEKKLFSKKRKHDPEALCAKAAEALRYITGECCDSEAADALSDRRAEFLSSVDALRLRLMAYQTDNTAN